MATHTLTSLKKLKVDCLYKRSTHFNAARRLNKSANQFRYFLVGGTIAASFSTIMNVGIWDQLDANEPIQVIVNILGALGGFLILYSTTFSDHRNKIEIANKHESIGNDLNLMFKAIRNTEALYEDKIISDKSLAKKLEKLTAEYSTRCYANLITKDVDFKKTKEDFDKGYLTEYSDKELNC